MRKKSKLQKNGLKNMVFIPYLGRMAPGVRELISIPDGKARMPLAKFVTFTFFGSLIWSLILVVSSYLSGNSWG
ncbi:hypothetical protein BH23THE1_BH23THE1_03010 [soil metagenome]